MEITLTTLLDELEKLDKDATPGPWYVQMNDFICAYKEPSYQKKRWNIARLPSRTSDYPISHTQWIQNPELIVETRNALPQLIQALRDAIEMAKFYGENMNHPLGECARAWLEKYGVKE